MCWLTHLGLELLLGHIHGVLALLGSHVVRETHRDRVLELLLPNTVRIRFLLFRHLAQLTPVFRLRQVSFRYFLKLKTFFVFSILSFVPLSDVPKKCFIA